MKRSCLCLSVSTAILLSAHLGVEGRASAESQEKGSRNETGRSHLGREASVDQPGASGGEVVLDNGVVGDGHLTVTLDAYGSFGDWIPAWPDLFDPSGEDDMGNDLPARSPTFATHMHVFAGDVGSGSESNSRSTPSSHFRINFDFNLCGVWGCEPGNQLEFQVTQSNTEDELPTRTTSQFIVARSGSLGPDLDLTFDVVQEVGVAVPGPNGEAAAFLDQTYSITNNLEETSEFRIVKHVDEDMPWATRGEGPYYADDLVGMDDIELGRPQVYAQDGALTSAALILRTRENMEDDSRTSAFSYYAGKQFVENGSDCVDYFKGTHPLILNNYGVPDCWKNVIPGAGPNEPGLSPQIDGDTSFGLQLDLSLPAGETYVVTFRTRYGTLAQSTQQVCQCDDGDACNGIETCDGSSCVPGTPVACDNGDSCDGVETCEPQDGSCLPGMIDDCDGNGIDDICDLQDCAGSPACGDCNENGIQDGCDIAGGTSDDANVDGVPDECEPQAAISLCDLAGAGGACEPDGSIDLFDVFAVLDGFQARFSSSCELRNIDIAGAGGICGGDGNIDLFDIFAVLDAFSDIDNCCTTSP